MQLGNHCNVGWKADAIFRIPNTYSSNVGVGEVVESEPVGRYSVIAVQLGWCVESIGTVVRHWVIDSRVLGAHLPYQTL